MRTVSLIIVHLSLIHIYMCIRDSTNRSIHIYTVNQGTTHITIGKGTLHPSVLIYHKEHQWFIVNLIDAANGINKDVYKRQVLYVSVFLILCHTCTIIYRVA